MLRGIKCSFFPSILHQDRGVGDGIAVSCKQFLFRKRLGTISPRQKGGISESPYSTTCDRFKPRCLLTAPATWKNGVSNSDFFPLRKLQVEPEGVRWPPRGAASLPVSQGHQWCISVHRFRFFQFNPTGSTSKMFDENGPTHRAALPERSELWKYEFLDAKRFIWEVSKSFVVFFRTAPLKSPPELQSEQTNRFQSNIGTPRCWSISSNCRFSRFQISKFQVSSLQLEVVIPQPMPGSSVLSLRSCSSAGNEMKLQDGYR